MISCGGNTATPKRYGETMLRRRDDYGWKVAAGMLLATGIVWLAVIIFIASATRLLLPTAGHNKADQTEAE